MRLTIPFIRLLHAVCAQAERSVDFLLQLQAEWDAFRSYFDSKTCGHMEAIRAKLPAHEAGCSSQDVSTRTRFSQWIRLPFGLMTGTRWYLRSDLEFVSARMDRLRSTLKSPSCPPPDELIRLRMDLYKCQHALERGAFGMNLRIGRTRVEHFGQSEFRQFETIDEIVETSATTGTDSNSRRVDSETSAKRTKQLSHH